MGEHVEKTSVTSTSPLSFEELSGHLRQSRAGEVQLSLELFHRDGMSVIRPLKAQSVSVGRATPADVVIRDSSLSRLHARFEELEGALWVEDLGSTNGTRVNDERVERIQLSLGDRLQLGVVVGVVRESSFPPSEELWLKSHDAFVEALEKEVERARTFHRTLSVLTVCCQSGEARSESHPNLWLRSIRPLLVTFQTAALYSFDTVEVLLPEAGEVEAREFAQKVKCTIKAPVHFGISVFPERASTAQELLASSRESLRRSFRNELPRETATLGLEIISSGQEPLEEPVIASQELAKIFETVDRVASSDIPVLIQGETGTGKEVVARAVHERGKRKDRPMVCVNCGAIPSQLVESTLFGHEKGAFTGAISRMKGVFESAEGGTVFLDEIGDLPLEVQPTLLRVLDTKRVSRVGSTKEIDLDVRIVAATNKELEVACKEGRFREDLLFRINAMTLSISPLRQRLEDIKALAIHFVSMANEANDRSVKGMDKASLRLLLLHKWVGNARELRNVIERAVVIAHGPVIIEEDLPEVLRAHGDLREKSSSDPESSSFELQEDSESQLQLEPRPRIPDDKAILSLRDEMKRVEADLISRALAESGWDRAEAARILELPLRTMARKMREHGISVRHRASKMLTK